MKKGFTLIELLAIIVILAIIALITIPIVTNTIEESRKNAFKSSVNKIEEVIDLDYNENARSGNITYKYSNNELVCVGCNKSSDLKLDFTGKIENGCGVVIYNGKVTSLEFKSNRYKATYENNKVVISNSDGDSKCDFDSMIPSSGATTELIKNVVTSGDGLYADSTENGRYVYKGTNPNNYIKIQETSSSTALYRIIAIESDGTYKIIRNDSIGSMSFDTNGTRYTKNGYCDDSGYGCNVWGSKTTMLDGSENNVASMSREYGSSTLYDLPDSEAYINTYLNSTWYKKLSSNFTSKITIHIFNVGAVGFDSSHTQSLETDLIQEKSYKWKGNIGLMNVTDFVKANTNTEKCGTVNLNTDNARNGVTCKTTNWFSNFSSSGWYIINPMFNSGYDYSTPWVAYNDGYLSTTDDGTEEEWGICPVVYLSKDIKLSGTGSYNDPYAVVS